MEPAAGGFAMNKDSNEEGNIGNIMIDRRTFLKAVGVLGAATLTGAYTADIVKAVESIDNDKNNVCVLGSVFGQGKTTSSIILEKLYRSQGLKVACLQSIKGEYDVGLYLKNNCHHYSLPVEAAKNRKTFEEWLPQGYDLYLVEMTYSYGAIAAAYIDLFENMNEIVSYGAENNWRSYAEDALKNHCANGEFNPNEDLMLFWDQMHNRNIKQVLTKVPSNTKTNRTYVDTKLNVHNADKLNFDSFTPRMKLPVSEKTAIAVGTFPGEYIDIFPKLKWYEYDYWSFLKRYTDEDYDVAIIGCSYNEDIKLKYIPKNADVICYQPPIYLNTTGRSSICDVKTDLKSIYSTIKTKSTDFSLGDEGCMYSSYNNKYWTYQPYPDLDIVERNDNLTICNGWILPQYLIREGMLEV